MSNTSGKPESPPPQAEPDGDREEAFLQRWSRRKHEAAQTPPAPAPAAEIVAPPEAPEKIVTDADMPPIESLDESSDFSVFMSAGVSEALRGLALRKLFLLPSINQRCPLDSEYYDCTNLQPLGDIITHDMREQFAREAAKLKETVTALVDDKKDEAAAPDAAATPLENEELGEAPASVAQAAKTSEPGVDSRKYPGSPDQPDHKRSPT